MSSLLIRLGGLAATMGGVVYAALGVMTLPIVPHLFKSATVVEHVPFVLLLVGVMASVVALHVLHKDLRRDRYGPLGLSASVMAVAGTGLLLVGGSATFVGLLLVTGGLVGGAVIGASLSLTFTDWRRPPTLALTGAVGFGGGLIVGVFALQGMSGTSFMVGVWGTVILCALAGTSGGASLGAAFGYLESRKLSAEQRPRVR